MIFLHSKKVHILLILSVLIFFTEYQIEARPSIVSLGVGDSGSSLIIWEDTDYDTGYSSVNVYIHSALGSWTALPTIATNVRYAKNPKIVVDPSNNAVAMWTSYDDFNGKNILYSSYYLDDGIGSWSIPVQVSASDNRVFDWSLELDANNVAIAVWMALTTNNQIAIFASDTTIGSDWNSPVQIYP